MRYFDQEILKGIDKIPTPNYPGSIIVTGSSQAVFTGENPGDTFLAACLYGNGKIFVSAHDCYLSWIHDQETDLKKKFFDNLKIWLTGANVSDPEIIDFRELVNKGDSFEDYKIIKWNHDYDPNDDTVKKVLSFVKKGGALLCGSTAWGYLQIYPNKKLDDMTLYRFLKKYTGIILTTSVLYLPDEIEVSKNKAKHSQLDEAIEKVKSNPVKLEKYFNTLQTGLDLIDSKKIVNIKKIVTENCTRSGWNTIPNDNYPICEVNHRNAIKLLGKCYIYTSTEKAPGIEHFPGDFDSEPELLQNVLINLETNFQERLSTGYYLPAGVCLSVNVLSENANGWSIRIGAHTDDLGQCDSLKRWPCVSLTKDLNNNYLEVSSAYGGLIYFESPGESSIQVNLNNVVESPYYDLTKPETISNWNKNRFSQGLWAELAGENIIFTTPSSCIRHIENPAEILKFWDTVCQTHHECRGTNAKDFKRERIVNDKQPSCGYMHSGYPIVTHLDCCQPEHEECIFDLEKLRENGNWGLFHELGHNLQRDEWTFEGCGEVTVNIFSMHATKFVIGQDIIEQKWPRGQISNFKSYFSKKPNYDDWKNNCGIALMTFAQLIKHFGWDSMHKFMKDYENDMNDNRDKLPTDNQDKIDQWVLRYSEIVSKNIKPQFEMFGLPVSNQVDNELAHLEPWCPENEKHAEYFFS